MDETVQDGIRDRGIAQGVMPLLDRELAGDDGRAKAMTIFEDLEEVMPLHVLQGLESQIVKD